MKELVSGHLVLLDLLGYEISPELPADLDQLAQTGRWAIVPYLTTDHAEELDRATHSYPGVTFVAALYDADGRKSVRAIHSGAARVLNLLIQPKEWALLLSQERRQEIVPNSRLGLLSAFEHEVLTRLDETPSISHLAHELFISERSTYRLLSRVYAKLEASGKLEALQMLHAGSRDHLSGPIVQQTGVSLPAGHFNDFVDHGLR